jgi:protease secretion system membrane fusion protein
MSHKPSTPQVPSSDQVNEVQTNTHLRKAALALGVGFICFLLWATLAPLDEGVPAQGSVVIDNKRKSIQHLQGGIIREVQVGEGAHVEQGQTLVVLEQATAKANMETVRQHYLALRATEGRLMAELNSLPKITFHADLLVNANDPYAQQHLTANERLFEARRAVLQANMGAQKEGQEASRAQIIGLQGVLREKTLQHELMAAQLERLKPLIAEGYAPRIQQIDLERLLAELRGQLEDIKANLQRAISQDKEFAHKIRGLQQDYFKEASQLLAEINRELLADQDKLIASKQDLQRTEILAPAKGQVVGLAPVTPGSIIGPGQKIMDIIPDYAELIIEARVPPQVIDRISPSQLADIRFSAFSHSPLLVIEGKVESVSNDLLTDPELKQSYYLARISLTPQGRETLGKKELMAGLPAEVMIKTGSRSLLSYLAYPLVRRLHKSLKEE